MPTDTTLDTIKNLSLYQKTNGYRFSIDAVLLADFVRKTKPSRIIDIGSGSGIIGILLAMKYPCSRIDMVEIQNDLYALGRKNIALNKCEKRVSAFHGDVNDLVNIPEICPHSYDIAVSNPPFRVPDTGRISPYDEKAIARHEISLRLPALIKALHYLLKPKGYAYIIFHPSRLDEVFGVMKTHRIEPKRARFVHPDPLTESKMVMIEGIKAARPSMKIEPPLFIYTKHGYTDEVSMILES
jgi:tRNA1Val (adenine37-N6)-methyltransferase